MNILITGAAGFIGSHVCEQLLQNKHTVIGVDDLNDYYDIQIKNENLKLLEKYDTFLFHKVDILNKSDLVKLFEQFNIEKIIHLAARAGVRSSVEHPGIYARVNVLGTVHLLEMAASFSCKQVIVASSSSVYGNNRPPFKETMSIVTPQSPYAASKVGAEAMCFAFHNIHNVPITILRFFTVYGPRGRPDMAPYIFAKKIWNNEPLPIYGDGTAKRDFTYVGDIVQGVINSLNKEFDFEVFNLGNGKAVVLNEFIDVLEQEMGKKAKLIFKEKRQADMDITLADISKAKAKLNYCPQTSIHTGVKQFVNWFKTIYPQ